MESLYRAYYRVRRSILKRYYARRRHPYIIRSIHHGDVFFLLNLDEKTDRLALIAHNEHEQLGELLAWAAAHGATHFLDIGANFGLYAVILAKQIPDARVLAFEPGADSRTRLAASALINQTRNIEILPCAASDTDGTKRFISNIAGHSGTSRIRDEQLLKRMKQHTGKFNAIDWEEITVETRTIDSLVQEAGENIAIKIDTEGHECEVLTGTERVLRNNNCYVQVEISPRLPEHREWVNSFMGKLGYTLTERITKDYIYKRKSPE